MKGKASRLLTNRQVRFNVAEREGCTTSRARQTDTLNMVVLLSVQRSRIVLQLFAGATYYLQRRAVDDVLVISGEVSVSSDADD